jgi:hypothetical protein
VRDERDQRRTRPDPRRHRRLAVTLVVAAALAVPAVPAQGGGRASAEPILHWNQVAGEAARAGCLAPTDNPLTESRTYAMVHIAIHDAVNAIDRRYRPYAYDGRVRGNVSLAAAVAAAARDVLVPAMLAIPAPFPAECGRAGAAVAEAAYDEALAAIPDGRAKSRGVQLGQAAAAAVLVLRADDGSDTPLVVPGYPQGTEPGQWRFTPDLPFAFAPGWGEVEPFALHAADQFRPGPPPALGSRQYVRDFREVLALGGDGVTTPSARTADQTEVARFWVESSPLAWNRIGRTLAGQQRLDAWRAARMFGLLNVALADGYIASFATKYHYGFWRPVTAIRSATDDGNPHTVADPTWTPLVTTPPIPDYESAHAVEGAAAATVFRAVLGTDRVRFSACSLTLPEGTCDDGDPTLRTFRRLSQAAAENAHSRVLVGFHFRTATEVGLDVGRDVGRQAVRTVMQPVDA